MVEKHLMTGVGFLEVAAARESKMLGKTLVCALMPRRCFRQSSDGHSRVFMQVLIWVLCASEV